MANKIIFLDGIANTLPKYSQNGNIVLTLNNVSNIGNISVNDNIVFIEYSHQEISSLFRVTAINNNDISLEMIISFAPSIQLGNLSTLTVSQPFSTNHFYDLSDDNINEIYSSINPIVSMAPISQPTQINRNATGENRIVYGAPGTGKSNYLDREYPNSKRVTFHPEMTYFDFVGGIKPILVVEPTSGSKNVSYEFVAGTFTQAWLEAYRNPDEDVTLIIEEINRANTASVFGDLFQLLDRNSSGISDYAINNTELVDYLKQEGVINEIDLIGDDWLKLPSNLTLVATMNSADQGVFVMDSAFKRRWRFEYLPINFEGSVYENNTVPGLQNITWRQFAETLNDHLCSKDINEDKLIGPYFVNDTDFSSVENFASKLLIYLWDDVVRYQRDEVFSRTDRFSKIIEIFQGNKPFDIFATELKKSLTDLLASSITTSNMLGDSSQLQTDDVDEDDKGSSDFDTDSTISTED